MTTAKRLSPVDAVNAIRSDNNGQVVLVLQGGGALGAYQGGVYQALHEANIEPDWIVGTSIGAINASIIAGNEPADRLAKLKDFWRRVEAANFWGAFPAWGGAAGSFRHLAGPEATGRGRGDERLPGARRFRPPTICPRLRVRRCARQPSPGHESPA